MCAQILEPTNSQSQPGPPPLVFISYLSKEEDVAKEFSDGLRSTGCRVFLAAESIRVGDEWPALITESLEACDYFLLLLSRESAQSQMVTQEVRKAVHLRENRAENRPRILPIRLNVPLESQVNFEVDAHLGRIHQLLWESSADTQSILGKISQVILGKVSDEIEKGQRIKPHVQPIEDIPLPVAEPEWPAGRVSHDSEFYVKRPHIDDDCFRQILRPAALIRISAPRQMGKTSLLARILDHARQNGCTAGQISFQLVADKTFADLETFLFFFCRRVSKTMGLANKLDEIWDKDNDVLDNAWTYFTEYLLPNLDRPFVLGLDEVDRLFQYADLAEQFLGMLRGFMDGRVNDDLWGKFRMILVHSTECYIKLNVNSSPFNIGRAFRLPPFNEDQVKVLASKHGMTLDDKVRRFYSAVSGHPYLTRLGLYLAAHEGQPLEQILREAATEAGPFSDHLRQHYWNLSQHSELEAAAKRVVAAQASADKFQPGTKAHVSLDSVAAFKLEGMGLVKAVGNDVSISCDVYQKYFQDRFHIKP